MKCDEMSAGKLLSVPLSNTDRAEVKFSRSHASDYKNLSEPFNLGKRDFHRQYFHIYGERLQRMIGRVETLAKETLGNDVTIKRLCELETVEDGSDVLIIGTLFKDQELKPNVLKDLCEEQALIPQPSNTRYVSDKDTLILEDDLQRIRLQGNIDLKKVVTGIVCGVFGHEVDGGKFDVKDVIFPKMPSQIERPIVEEDRFIAFVSGLELGGPSADSLGPLQLAVDWLCGDAGEMGDQESNAKIERLVIVGNSLNESTRDKELMNKAKYLTKDAKAGSVDAVKTMDDILVQLAGSMDVDLMPGPFDPANQIMPQQPLHKCLFPLASVYATLQTVTNPYFFSSHGIHILGTSGQNIDDVNRCADFDSPVDSLSATLGWSHIAPTCPDTLGCFPYLNTDPFILNACPHVYFAGNQSKFDDRLFEGKDGQKVRLISLPKFSETSKITLLNLRTQECHSVSFAMQFGSGTSPQPEK